MGFWLNRRKVNQKKKNSLWKIEQLLAKIQAHHQTELEEIDEFEVNLCKWCLWVIEVQPSYQLLVRWKYL